MSQVHLTNNYTPPKPKRKYCLFLYNRATYSRCLSLINKMEECSDIELTLMISGSLLHDTFGKLDQYIEKAHKRVKYKRIPIEEYNHHPLRHLLQSAEIVKKVGEFLHGRDFTACFVVADRYETLPTALACAYLNFPIIHLQGGEVTGNIDERVRHATTKLADYHFVCTNLAKEYVIKMGEEKRRVFHVGCPSLDIIKEWKIRRKHAGRHKFIICVFHPDTEIVNEQFEQTRVVLEAVLDFCLKNDHVCFWFWPNPDPGREEITRMLDQIKEEHSKVFVKAINKDPFAFLKDLSICSFVVGNSSVGLRECSFIGVPAVNIGNRQNLRERSWNVIDVPVDKEEIIKAMEVQKEAYRYKFSYLYGRGESANYIVAQLSRLEISKKGPLNYPFLWEFRQKHLGEARFDEHGKPIKVPIIIKKICSDARKRGAVSSESRSVATASYRRTEAGPGDTHPSSIGGADSGVEESDLPSDTRVCNDQISGNCA